MERLPRWLTPALFLAALAGVVIPIVVLWLQVWRQPSLSPAEVQQRLAAGTAVLVDVRSEAEQVQRCITGSLRLADAPQDRTLVLVCGDGLGAPALAAELRAAGRDAVTMTDGLAGWLAAARHPGVITTGMTCAGVDGPIPVRQESQAIQWLTMLTGFVVKPAYMLLALVAALLLRRARTPGTVALRRALWLFFAGEAFCAMNYLACDEDGLIVDHLHSVGMLLAVSFAAWAMYCGIHRHLLGGDGQRCALTGWCQPCTREDVCRIDRAVPLLWMSLALVACVPLSAEPLPTWVTLTNILGTPYAYRHDMAHQLIEMRWYPLVGLTLLVIALPFLLRRRHAIAALWCCAAAGPIVFALFRTVLLLVWRDDPAWFLAWEEFGELATIIAVWWWLPTIRRASGALS